MREGGSRPFDPASQMPGKALGPAPPLTGRRGVCGDVSAGRGGRSGAVAVHRHQRHHKKRSASPDRYVRAASDNRVSASWCDGANKDS